jgi:hypothetical protein
MWSRYTCRMTTLLEQAFAEVSKLSPTEQDAIAAILLDSLTSDSNNVVSVQYTERLALLIAEARADIAAGRVRQLSSTDF